ncbi:NADP-dependent glyceraldehyde-3-phosphate dehydrogenase [Ferribacterium limneticum]|uniref:NADP-dependent glyceraldehyde-3-phosphate dehydrogenase n=1 Tax=Ferribacterium limneticum TaxID=76259 RepID=UPI001CF87B22|nr:NADP-dependent glyceraldehyde-3-phosphate dehydrogenase [Ferribacterium limneticum]UCV24582.1 NADP-dependent glyceraldehyde-3-phosphate dehydrogenase [Ferribacterium limneticum]
MKTAEQLAALFPRESEIPGDCRILAPIHQRAILINGEMQIWKGETRTVHSPVCVQAADGTLSHVELGSVPVTGTVEADAALAAAVTAYDHGRGQWPNLSVAERIACVGDFTNQIVARRREIVNLIMWEIGKSLADSQKEFDRTIDYIRATVEELKRLDNSNSRFEIVDGTIAQIRRSPVGIALCMGPYNYPMNETFSTLIPALIMGNVVLFKPPRFGVLLYYPMLEAFRSAFPPGVINIVYGQGHVVVPHIMGSGKVNVLALIGSSEVADQLKKSHPKTNRLRAILGLGAKNAAIIMADADIELTVKECITGSLSFNGQRCTAIKMILVHQSIAEQFLRRFCEEVGKLAIGMPWEAGVMLTPLPEMEMVAYMNECIADAIEKGAKVINPGGGGTVETLFYPAVLFPVKEGMKLYREEQFGPIIPVATFEDIETPLDYVITSDHGQQVSIFGSDPGQIASLVDTLVNQVCRVNINCQCQRGPDVFPFVGRKDSAEGTLSVHDALRAFSIRTMVAAKQTEASKKLLDAIVLGNKSNFINTHFIL